MERLVLYRRLAFSGLACMVLSFFANMYSSIAGESFFVVGVGLLAVAAVWRFRKKDLWESYGYWPYKGKWNQVPVKPQHAARRALCLSAMVLRSEWEEAIRASPPESRDFEAETRKRLVSELDEWLRQEELTNSLTEAEKKMLSKPVGEWGESEIVSAGWRRESIVALAWALGWLDEMPPYDNSMTSKSLLFQVQALKPTQSRITSSRLRTGRQVAEKHLIAFLWQLRAALHIYQTDSKLRSLGSVDTPTKKLQKGFDDMLRIARNRGLIRDDQSDLVAFGVPFSKMPADTAWGVGRLAKERVHTLGWLLGEIEKWDEESSVGLNEVITHTVEWGPM